MQPWFLCIFFILIQGGFGTKSPSDNSWLTSLWGRNDVDLRKGDIDLGKGEMASSSRHEPLSDDLTSTASLESPVESFSNKDELLEIVVDDPSHPRRRPRGFSTQIHNSRQATNPPGEKKSIKTTVYQTVAKKLWPGKETN
ncbi:hypothetical protein PCANC_21000 [Puccinia coronata f. sp. avenae]|uniref:Uncharacterized protein n=1 Tax=Puccinia coronata f. sp. avenae TaxID=200324 RepID=A0A2N5TIV6_9BASI|nr:hypothetical protein PCANC_22966 [Puccinia coronata f. sp. avenae]PLW25338.1 hypothetical protein PCASD_26256 [Puccinia coronata f. sp. avenae]PLW33250.1 hypothetical protein PCANC_21000 [Puccinia coronata f. sp. avenae]